jgi:alkylated DNA repair dioxygenase AlkB
MNDPEVTLTPAYLSPAEADELFRTLVNEVDWDTRMKARKTACFGQTYDDSGVDYEVKPMHALLLPLCIRLHATLGFEPSNCLLNYYENGRSSMGFHSDATYNLARDTGIAIVSLGAERTLTYRSKADPADLRNYSLPHGSLLYMTQRTQDFWTHAVKKSDTDDARISLTFRRILSGIAST